MFFMEGKVLNEAAYNKIMYLRQKYKLFPVVTNIVVNNDIKHEVVEGLHFQKNNWDFPKFKLSFKNCLSCLILLK